MSGIFQACKMSAEDAGLLATTLVQADLRGCHSHGVLRVPEYVFKLREGGVDPAAKPLVVHDAKGALVVDGNNSMGQIGSCFAMQEAICRAREYSLALAAVRGSNHCGAMAYYAMLALPEDMIGIAATHALPTMAPWGGVDKILGINPLAVAIPAGEEDPIVLDAAFSGSSHGKIRVYQQKGEPIPPDWAFDADGHPTTDPSAAINGLLQPIGGYKGTGLALVMGILSTLLSGASYGTELGNMVDGPQAGKDGHFYLAIKVSAFVDLPEFKGRVDTIVRQIRNGRKASNGHASTLRENSKQKTTATIAGKAFRSTKRRSRVSAVRQKRWEWMPQRSEASRPWRCHRQGLERAMQISRSVPPVLFALCLSGLLAGTQDEELFELVKVKDRIYPAFAKPQYKLNCNAAVIINEDDVVIVDSHSKPSAAKALLKQIRKITQNPVRHVVNTHFHYDHARGNQAYFSGFPHEVTLISSEQTRKDLIGIEAARLKKEVSELPGIVSKLEQDLNRESDGKKKLELAATLNQVRAYHQELKSVELVLPGLTSTDR